jgi:restriction system protein
VNEIEVAIEPGQVRGMYRVIVVRSPAGEASEVVSLDVDALLERRAQLENAVLASAAASRSLMSATERPIREAGMALFSALLGSGDVAGRYRASAALAASSDQGLRVILRIDDPALAGLPWEAMYDEVVGAYVCRRDHLVRTVPVPAVAASLTVRPPLRVLGTGIVSSPRGLAALDVGEEQDQLARALSGLAKEGLVEVQWAPEATWASLHEKLLGGEWHVVHFIGHGAFDTARDEGLLALVGESGRAEWVEADRLVDLLRQARPMPRLVVLNSCQGASAGEQDLFAGTAAALVRGGVAAVAAMQYAISDAAAVAFARGFYAAIAHGRGVDDAVSSGRVGILGVRARTLEWVTPVMYLRGHDPRLFVVPPRPPSASELRQTSLESTPGMPALHHLTDSEQRDSTQVADWRSRPGESSDRAADPPVRVQRRLAEAQFRTDELAWRITQLERLLPDRPRTLSSHSDLVERVFTTEGPDAFVAALQQVLATSRYPDGLTGSCRALYRPENRELVMDYELPRPDIVPTVAEYRYVPTDDLMQELARPRSETRKLYAQLIARLTLRVLAEAFDVAPVAVVQRILLNGHVAAGDSGAGKSVRPCLISVQAGRDAFAEIELDEPELDPRVCLTKYLNAVLSPHPYDLERVRPVLQIDLSKYKFVKEMSVEAGLPSRPDLLALTPTELEHLIRELFKAMGIKSWVTQGAKDRGIDVVAVNEDPIFGGLCIIQVKRYSISVGLEALHALAGAVQDKSAAKGILVTTSRVSQVSRDFAARHGRIEIIEGHQLKALLKEHLALDVVIGRNDSR